MTRDEIIKMAVAARLLEIVDDAYLERCDWEPYVARFFRAAYEAGAAAEREACERMCREADKSTHPADLADAIRARGEK
jgi:hypothetical protein